MVKGHLSIFIRLDSTLKNIFIDIFFRAICGREKWRITTYRLISLNVLIVLSINRQVKNPRFYTVEYHSLMSVRAIRGAIQAEENSVASISAATKELLLAILKENNLSRPEIISVILTATPDLNATFPAAAAREIGFESVPLLCAVEIDVPGALPLVIRAMVTVNTELKIEEISHVYLGGAKALRKDIAQ